jgi:hypothetical protein
MGGINSVPTWLASLSHQAELLTFVELLFFNCYRSSWDIIILCPNPSIQSFQVCHQVCQVFAIVCQPGLPAVGVSRQLGLPTLFKSGLPNNRQTADTTLVRTGIKARPWALGCTSGLIVD